MPSGPEKVVAVKGELDGCEYPSSGMPREPPGVRARSQPQHVHLRLHSPMHSSAVVGDPQRPVGHQPTPAPPPRPANRG